MIADYTIYDYLKTIENLSSHEEQLYKILEGYVELFPVLDSKLFRFSPLGYLGEGIISLNASGLTPLGEFRDDIRSFPVIFSAIHEKRAKYCEGIDYFKQISSKYVIPSSVSSIAVTPICFGSNVIGYICSSTFEENLTVDDDLLSSFTLYGKLVGNLIGIFNNDENSHFLSNRELEVMRRISWGESTKEMAQEMKISTLTINQYVKSAMKKLGAHNRAHAIGELHRRGIIS